LVVVAACGLLACGDDGTDAPEATPDAADDALPGDAVADTVAPPKEAEAHTLTLVDRLPVTLLNGRSQNVTFDVPHGIVSLTVTVDGEADGMYALDHWSGPGDSTLVTSGWLDGGGAGAGLCLDCPNRIVLAEGTFAALAPNNPVPTVVPGTHVLGAFGMRPKPVAGQTGGTCGDGVCTFIEQFTCPQDCAPEPISGEVLLSVHGKVSDEGDLPDRGVLDLNLFFTGARWTAATAAEDPEFQALLGAVDTIYGQVGVSLGELTYYDVDPRFQVIESVQGGDSDLMELFRSSEGAAEGAVNLFFVDELSAGAFGGFGVILGIAGGIPGPAIAHGSHRSGVAVAVREIPGAPAALDTTVAHEIGHFLGLFHTSEQNFGGFGPSIHDPLPDTPHNDETYLMYNTGSGTLLSPWQGIVMRSNPWVRHPVEAPAAAGPGEQTTEER